MRGRGVGMFERGKARRLELGPRHLMLFLWKIAVETSAEAEEAVLELLERCFGVPAASCTDLETGAVVAAVFVKSAGSPAARLRPPDRTRILAGLEHIRACGLAAGPGRVSVRRLRAQDWAESWKRHFRPIQVSPALVIQPSWSRRKPRRGQKVVILDPGLSFGTGQHPTTGFCLEQIARHEPPGHPRSLLDIGCGSGILAIAAAKLGYQPVEGLDVDADAVRIARKNAVLNGVKVRFRQADVGKERRSGGRQFDLVCANLTDDLLLAQRPRIAGRVRPGGRLVLAGILEHQFPAVRSAYQEAGFQLETSRTAGGWRSGSFRRLA
jgi:ribosomal protein L11 methyltransferase